YSPLANLSQMVYESRDTSPSAVQEFQHAVLGETFVPPGGRLTLDVLDRCRRDYSMPQGCADRTSMGVDVGTKLHVVVRQPLDEIFHAFQTQAAELPADARHLGGRVRDGLGEYYREMTALTRVSRQDSQGNWVAPYVDGGKADHFAHAEAYCARALTCSFSALDYMERLVATCRNCTQPVYLAPGVEQPQCQYCGQLHDPQAQQPAA